LTGTGPRGHRAAGAWRRSAPNHMNRDQIIARLRDLLQKQSEFKGDVNAIHEDTKIDQMGFDSISILDFMYDVEADFQVQTEVGDLVKMEKVKDLVDYLAGKLSNS
jgi:acyl carrier protein